MADVFSQRSDNGDIIAMLRRADRSDGSQTIEISDNSPDTSRIVLSRQDARELAEAILASCNASDPAANGEAAARGGHIHLRPEIVNGRLAAAMTQGL